MSTVQKKGRWEEFRYFFNPKPRVRKLHSKDGEAGFLEGKHSRIYEFFRVLRIGVEFVRGFWGFHFIGPAITVFGSARFKEDHPYCKLARQIGKVIAEEGFVTVTGGGPGIMQATNQGAKEAGGFSVGANIKLPHEQAPNPYLDKVVTFYYFFVRKVILVKYSCGFVVLPGGYGTLDELTEALTLIQTGKLYDFPVILVGKEYWAGFIQWAKDTLVAQGTISAEEFKFVVITDDPEKVRQLLRHNARTLALPVKPLITEPLVAGHPDPGGEIQ